MSSPFARGSFTHVELIRPTLGREWVIGSFSWAQDVVNLSEVGLLNLRAKEFFFLAKKACSWLNPNPNLIKWPTITTSTNLALLGQTFRRRRPFVVVVRCLIH
jgi:hypothetical protein